MRQRDKILREHTGEDSAVWVERFQELISANFYDSDDPNHPYTHVQNWLDQVTAYISDCVDTEQEYDENIRAGAIASLVFTTWTARIMRAKAYDTNRPVRNRRRALAAYQRLVAAVIEAATDESRDADYFPGQEWNPPYGPSARGGTLI